MFGTREEPSKYPQELSDTEAISALQRNVIELNLSSNTLRHSLSDIGVWQRYINLLLASLLFLLMLALALSPYFPDAQHHVSRGIADLSAFLCVAAAYMMYRCYLQLEETKSERMQLIRAVKDAHKILGVADDALESAKRESLDEK